MGKEHHTDISEQWLVSAGLEVKFNFRLCFKIHFCLNSNSSIHMNLFGATNLDHREEFSPSHFDVSSRLTIYKVTTCCLESASLWCYIDPHCTQAYKQSMLTTLLSLSTGTQSSSSGNVFVPPRLPHNERDSLESAEGTATKGLRSFHT